MKKIFTLLALVTTLSVNAQIDTVIYNAPHPEMDTLIAYRIDTLVTGGSSDSNMVWISYHYIQTTGDSFLYQPQFIMYDSLNLQILPNVDLMNAGWRASGTVKKWYIDSAMAAQTPKQLRDSLIYPILQSVYGNNVTKL
ncbi:MAG: hypothetical protein ACUZ8E_07210 [Candidatus Anammoxibacter sp.]